MNILVLNGSPRGERSNTFKITNTFLNGMNQKSKNNVDIINISKMDIQHCSGCFNCWTKTPGHCTKKDDMAELTEKYIGSDLIIWSFPLYTFGMPSKIKAFLDRLLPLSLPNIEADSDRNRHPSRYDLSKQAHVLISSCGFYSVKNNYDALFRQFEIMFHKKLTKIICPEGELLYVPELSERVDEYLLHVKTAGAEYSTTKSISKDTQEQLDKLLYPPEVFLKLANTSWEMQNAEKLSTENNIQTKDVSFFFLQSMSILYNPDMYTKDMVLEMHFTDLNKTYQLLLGKKECILKTESFLPYTTRIETPFSLWRQISEGTTDGSEALMKKQYKVLGDFDLLLKMNDFFGSGRLDSSAKESNKSTNMILLLLPFLAFWILLPFDYMLGGIAGTASCGLVVLLYFWWKPTPYEQIGIFTSLLTGIFIIVSGGAAWQISLPYFVSGIIWLASSMVKIPLTAYYSNKDYGNEEAFKNPLFIQTNRILTVVWGITYIVLGITALSAGQTAFLSLIQGFTWILVFLLGIFTKWFAGWYPLKVLKG